MTDTLILSNYQILCASRNPISPSRTRRQQNGSKDQSSKTSKIEPNTFQNQAQTEQKKVPKESSTKKCWKMKNEQPSIVFAIFLLSASLEKQRKMIQNQRKFNFKFRCALEHNFLLILVDLGANLGSQIEPESWKKQVEKHVDFKKKRGWRPDLSKKQWTQGCVGDLTRLGPRARRILF